MVRNLVKMNQASQLKIRNLKKSKNSGITLGCMQVMLQNLNESHLIRLFLRMNTKSNQEKMKYLYKVILMMRLLESEKL
jgi:hypothetical protein